jgi:hypothetical protein
VTSQQSLVGTWVGSVPGDEGACGGDGTGQWVFGSNGTYQFGASFPSGECGYTVGGYYQVQGDIIYFQPQNSPSFQQIYGNVPSIQEYYEFYNGYLIMCDNPAWTSCLQYGQVTA